MNVKHLVLAGYVVAMPVVAQVPSSGSPAGQAVGSPNRVPVDAMAAPGRHRGIEPDLHREALQVVDGKGRVLGRLEGADLSRDFGVTVNYKGELASVPLGPVYSGIPFPSPNGGLTWPPFQVIHYTSGDCSGDAYLPPSSPGTNYIGRGLVENGKNYILIGNMTRARQVNLGSRFDIEHQQCIQVDGRPLIVAVPVEASENIDRIATPPFYVK